MRWGKKDCERASEKIIARSHPVRAEEMGIWGRVVGQEGLDTDDGEVR